MLPEDGEHVEDTGTDTKLLALLERSIVDVGLHVSLLIKEPLVQTGNTLSHISLVTGEMISHAHHVDLTDHGPQQLVVLDGVNLVVVDMAILADVRQMVGSVGVRPVVL